MTMRRPIHTTGKRYVVRQAWREFYPDSALPSAGPLMEAVTVGSYTSEIALLYKGAVIYVDRDYCEEVTHDVPSRV